MPEDAGASRPYRPQPADVIRFLQQMAVLGETPRFLQLDRYEAFYEGSQYDHQTYDWWGKPAALTEVVSPESVMAPGFVAAGGPDNLTVREKKPTAPKNLVKTIVNRYTGLLFSEKRTPAIHVAGDPDTESYLRAVAEDSEFWSIMRSARRRGGGQGSTCVTAHLDEGRFTYEVHNSKQLTVLWKSRRTWEPYGFLKMYKYPASEEVRDPKSGQVTGFREVDMLYRRIITDTVDVTFRPVKVQAGMTLTWDPDPRLSSSHGLGYFPGVWIQNTAETETHDGRPDCDGAFQTCDTIDRLIAQMNKGVLNNLDPTPVIGVDETEVGTVGGVRKGSDHALYVGKSGKASYLEMTGGGIEIGLKYMEELKQTVADLTGYVFADPEKAIGSAQSAKAMEYLFAPMTERADDLRVQYGKAASKLLRLTEKMARKFAEAPDFEMPPDESGRRRVGRYKIDLPPRQMEIDLPDGTKTTKEVEQKLGPGGFMTLKFGPYFAPTVQDENQRIQNAVAAKTGGLVRQRTAIKSTADIFAVEDVDAELAAIQQEQEQEASMMMGGGGAVPFGGGGDEVPPALPDDPQAALPPIPDGGDRGPPAGEGGLP